jgi:hypothetical protein
MIGMGFSSTCNEKVKSSGEDIEDDIKCLNPKPSTLGAKNAANAASHETLDLWPNPEHN